MIRRRRDGESLWLALWNRDWDVFHFVVGQRLPDESYRDCLVRELEEGLGLRDGGDCVVGLVPLAHVVYTAWSNQARSETRHAMELFAVDLDERAEVALDEDPSVRWLSDDEIRHERCHDGLPVSATMGFLIAKSRLV